MSNLIKLVLPLALSISLASWAAVADAPQSRALGWVEYAEIQPWGIKVKVKLDSGALTSSMQAEDIEVFERDDREWARFTLEVEDEASGEVVSKSVEKPIYREYYATGVSGREHRHVVLMKMCIGDTIYEEQFSLADRDNMIYPVLLGRRTIQTLGNIDVTRTFVTDPECDENSPVMRHAEKQNDDDIGI